ncbi:MAG: hypothetical protein AVDCRST_MAG90-1196 [uncultured Microvirga sp.]|uniref:BPL/LPL catalytic domain-containing protein n=1 Tax=uncultured Microvirga sp. TaxID=412392 RepID=A0A6J4L882_9HYPH|nr:MAG: hypothetical protein AVDCRST_MAG90-1196 [uncultured Microvirga sp.]
MSGSAAALRPRALDLPPAFSVVTLREHGDAFAHACRIAPEVGAGAFVHVGRFDLVEFAVVLEPEEPLRLARRGFFAGMVALAQAIGAFGPAEKAVEFEWPDAVRFDGARVGGGRLGWPVDCPDDATPEWLVFGASLAAARIGGAEPGLSPMLTTLEDEGFEDGRVVAESFGRHLMLAFDAWSERGFAPIEAAYLRRLPRKAGAQHRLDHNGALLTA